MKAIEKELRMIDVNIDKSDQVGHAHTTLWIAFIHSPNRIFLNIVESDPEAFSFEC